MPSNVSTIIFDFIFVNWDSTLIKTVKMQLNIVIKKKERRKDKRTFKYIWRCLKHRNLNGNYHNNIYTKSILDQSNTQSSS